MSHIHRESIVKARKPHKCWSCGVMIGIGETYLCISGHDIGGMFGTWHCHQDCNEWEAHMNREAGARWDEGLTVSEQVDEGGLLMLNGAPQSLRDRFARRLRAERREYTARLAEFRAQSFTDNKSYSRGLDTKVPENG